MFVASEDRRHREPNFSVLRRALVAAALLSTVSGWTAWASDGDCELPGYLGDPEDATDAPIHYHPTVAIVVYVRHGGEASPLGQVTKLVMPPDKLGVHTLSSRMSENWIYRRIHSHDESGVLHVEPEAGRIFRICHLFKLWQLAAGTSQPFRDFDPRKPVTVMFGQEHMENLKLDELLMVPLNNDHRIIVLVEEGQMM
jgi:hypothetical protein